MDVELDHSGVTIAAEVLAGYFDLSPAQVPVLMRQGAITSRFEQGVAHDAGRIRLTFWYVEKRVRFIIGPNGQILEVDTAHEPERGHAA